MVFVVADKEVGRNPNTAQDLQPQPKTKPCVREQKITVQSDHLVTEGVRSHRIASRQPNLCAGRLEIQKLRDFTAIFLKQLLEVF